MGEIRLHRESIDKDGSFFCRSMNIRTRETGWLCRNCPLCAKDEAESEGEKCCRYADSDEEFPVYWMPPEAPHGVFDELPQKAIRFAAVAHKGAVRKGNGYPYIIHPMETMMLVSGMTDDPEVMAAAALHDVIEDTRYTGRDIEQAFGRHVAELVGMESEDKKRHRPAKDTWRERKEENLRSEMRAPREAKQIMLSDKLSNIRSTLRDYEKLGDAVWQKFNMKDPAEQEWYYRTVAKVVEELSDESAYQEYLRILDIVF